MNEEVIYKLKMGAVVTMIILNAILVFGVLLTDALSWDFIMTVILLDMGYIGWCWGENSKKDQN